jgi:hypothetical protein
VREGLVNLEDAVRARTSSVDNALGDAFVVEAGDLLAEVEVLDQRRTAKPCAEGVVGVGDGNALVSCQSLALGTAPEGVQLFVFRLHGAGRRFGLRIRRHG